MAAPSFEMMAPLMFGALIVVLLLGYPVAFSLAAIGLGFGAIAIEMGYFSLSLLQALPDRVYGIMSNQLLLSIPFFTFMGAILERCGLAEDLLDTMGQLFGPIRGGLAYAVIIVGALLGAITGTVAASVIAMGLISLPVMMRYGYDPKVATGVIAASGTITQIIPPSLVLVVLADAMGKSVGDMYAGAFIPSFILVGLFCLYIFALSIFKPHLVPALPLEVRKASVGVLLVRCMVSMVPSLALIFMVLGTILLGLATPTEGGAMGVVGALALAIATRRLNMKLLREAMDMTLKLTTMVMFILVGSTVFTLTFRGVDGDLWVESLLSDLPGGVVGFLIFVNIFIFFLAFFLDYFEIAFIIIPLLAPVAEKMGIDLIWFGVLIGVNMQTSFMHPPFGFALFYLRSIAPPSIKSSDILLGSIPWVLIMLVMVLLVILFPGMVSTSVSVFGRF
jgi:tripartite ATP-independent transporter DctM subunit